MMFKSWQKDIPKWAAPRSLKRFVKILQGSNIVFNILQEFWEVFKSWLPVFKNTAKSWRNAWRIGRVLEERLSPISLENSVLRRWGPSWPTLTQKFLFRTKSSFLDFSKDDVPKWATIAKELLTHTRLHCWTSLFELSSSSGETFRKLSGRDITKGGAEL